MELEDKRTQNQKSDKNNDLQKCNHVLLFSALSLLTWERKNKLCVNLMDLIDLDLRGREKKTKEERKPNRNYRDRAG